MDAADTATQAPQAPVKRTFMDKYIAWFHRWMPESFVICLGLTIFVAVLAWIATKTPLWSPQADKVTLVSSWTGAFWSLLAFTMQMTVLLATGNAVAASPPAHKLLSKVARLPKTRTQIILMGAIGSALLGYIHWGLGMMAGIVLGKELLVQAKAKGIKIHMPVLIGAIFMAFLPATAGISGAAVLYAATPGYVKKLVPDQYKAATPESLPLTDTVIRLDFLLLLALSMAIAIIFNLLMHPKDESKILEIDDKLLGEFAASSGKIEIDRSTPAAKANASRWIMYLIGGIGLIFSVMNLWKLGVMGLNLDSFNFLFLTLGMVLCAHWGPEYYAKLIREGIEGTWGFILQFPFYAGIFGLISKTGLGVTISHAFTSISTVHTWPVIAYLYSALLNIAVPSGGSKFVIEAPYIVPTTIDLGSNLGLVLQAYQMGDGTTNLIIPFFALPYLANFKLKFNQIVAYTVPPVLMITVVTCIYLLIAPMLG